MIPTPSTITVPANVSFCPQRQLVLSLILSVGQTGRFAYGSFVGKWEKGGEQESFAERITFWTLLSPVIL